MNHFIYLLLKSYNMMNYLSSIFTQNEIKLLHESINAKKQKSKGQNKLVLFQFAVDLNEPQNSYQQLTSSIGYKFNFSGQINKQIMNVSNPIIQIKHKLRLIQETKINQILDGLQFHINNPTIYVQKIYTASKALTKQMQPVVIIYTEPYLFNLQELLVIQKNISLQLFELIVSTLISFYKFILVSILDPKKRSLKLSYSLQIKNIIITTDLKIKIGYPIISSHQKMNSIVCKNSQQESQVTVNLILRKQICFLIAVLKSKIKQGEIRTQLNKFLESNQGQQKIGFRSLHHQILACSQYFQNYEFLGTTPKLSVYLSNLKSKIQNKLSKYINKKQQKLAKLLKQTCGHT